MPREHKTFLHVEHRKKVWITPQRLRRGLLLLFGAILFVLLLKGLLYLWSYLDSPNF